LLSRSVEIEDKIVPVDHSIIPGAPVPMLYALDAAGMSVVKRESRGTEARLTVNRSVAPAELLWKTMELTKDQAKRGAVRYGKPSVAPAGSAVLGPFV